MRTHLQSKTSIYIRWAGIKARCGNPNNKEFKRYGGRGIKLCKRWQKFENFLKDMGHPPSPHHTIDRIDNNGDYSPKNCRWATYEEQQSNRRNNTMITFKGETHCLSKWSRKVGISRSLIILRLKQGWSVSDALSKPLKNKHRPITYKGKTLNAREWSIELGINQNTIWGRMKRGWEPKRILGFE